tara:strand:+ start:33998 stop:34999 length:1002 start_codon:yes stop_codon:yes gene_type:complete
MQRVRLVKINDLSQLYDLINSGGSGLTTMPKTKNDLRSRILWSENSLSKKFKKPNNHSYLFILEDKKRIMGISAIYTSVSKSKPSVFFKRKELDFYSNSLQMKKTLDVFQLSFIRRPYTELGTLFVNPRFRGYGGGKLLSFSRFLFMSLAKERFDPKIFVEIRGYKDKSGVTTFWKDFSSNFFDLDFFDADRISYIDNYFIGECIPRFPFLISSLPKKVQNVIGKPHPSSKLAYKLLLAQNFSPNKLIDVLDGGPCLSADIKKIPLINNQQDLCVKIINYVQGNYKGLIFTKNIQQFFAISTAYDLDQRGNICISKNAANALNVLSGDTVGIA